MKKIIKICLLTITMSSCVSYYDITVKEDGSAFAKTGRYLLNDLERYYNSKVIYNIDTNALELNFDISDIDSLGNYLPLLHPGFIKFHMDSNTLTVVDGQTQKAFEVNDWTITSIWLVLNFNQDINLKSSSGWVTKKKNNSVWLKKSRRKLLKGKKKLEAEIEIILLE